MKNKQPVLKELNALVDTVRGQLADIRAIILVTGNEHNIALETVVCLVPYDEDKHLFVLKETVAEVIEQHTLINDRN